MRVLQNKGRLVRCRSYSSIWRVFDVIQTFVLKVHLVFGTHLKFELLVPLLGSSDFFILGYLSGNEQFDVQDVGLPCLWNHGLFSKVHISKLA